MPFKSNLSFENFGFDTLPAKSTFLHLLSFKILMILPNCPIDTGKDFLSFLNFLLPFILGFIGLFL